MNRKDGSYFHRAYTLILNFLSSVSVFLTVQCLPWENVLMLGFLRRNNSLIFSFWGFSQAGLQCQAFSAPSGPSAVSGAGDSSVYKADTVPLSFSQGACSQV